jgi:tetratricopeptide (TPR) repeat protein
MAQKDYGRAIQKFEALQTRHPEDPQVVRSLCMAYWKKGDHNNALLTMEKLPPLLASRPLTERAEVHRYIGDLHRIIGDGEKAPKARLEHYDRALKAYEKALDLNGKDKEAQKSWEEVAEERKALKIQMLQSS